MKTRLTLVFGLAVVILGLGFLTRGSQILPKEEVNTAVRPVSSQTAKKEIKSDGRITLSVQLDPQFAP